MKAIALLSGGLDSTLAVRIILDQGIEVEALKFTSPFCQCDNGGCCFAVEAAGEFGIPIKTIPKGADYLEIVRNPKFGYGSGMNPCIDCRIYMLKKAKAYAESIDAAFMFTGEVLGQRPMSQHRSALSLIEKESGLEGKLLRPLSALYLPETEAEKQGWVDRKKLLSISGRSRKTQLCLAKEYNINSFSCPAGGCLLTDKNFARRMRDLVAHKDDLTLRDISILKVGRHFRYRRSKIIAGRNEKENAALKRLKDNADYLFEVRGCGSPATLLQGEINDESIGFAAALTAAYSDAREEYAGVSYGNSALENTIRIKALSKSDIDSFRI